MHSLTILVGENCTPWMLMFKTEEKAGIIYNAYVTVKMQPDSIGGVLVGCDDFGQTFAIPYDGIRGMMLENLDLSQEAYVERGLHNARSQAKAQEKAMTDPKLMAAMRRQGQGPAVLQPGGMMPGRMS